MSDIRFNRWLHQSGTGGVYQDSTGRVGIGTSVPTSALDVQSGTIKIGNNTLSSSGVSTFSSGIVISAGTTAAPSITPTGDSNTGIFFPSADTVCIGEGGSEVIRVNSSGNVGIGTINPQARLHLCAPTGSDAFLMLDDVNRNAIIYAPGTGSSSQGLFYLRRGTPSSFTDQLLIDGNGNVRKPLQSFCDTGDTTSWGSAGSLTVIGASSAKGNWSSTVTNVGNNFSTSTDLYTCPASGAYAISCTCSMDNVSGRIIFVLSINGGYEEITEIFDNYENQSPCVIRYCSANDTIGLGINGTGGSDYHVRLQVYFLG
jgi:hypothetical protein